MDMSTQMMEVSSPISGRIELCIYIYIIYIYHVGNLRTPEMVKNMKCSYIFMAEITVPGFQSVIRVKMFVDSPVFLVRSIQILIFTAPWLDFLLFLLEDVI